MIRKFLSWLYFLTFIIKSAQVASLSLGPITGRLIISDPEIHGDVKFRIDAQLNAEMEGCPPKLFIFGMGYVGSAVAHALHELGWEVCGSCRRADWDHARELEVRGIRCHQLDLDETPSPFHPHPDVIADVISSSYVLSTVPPLLGAELESDAVVRACGTLLLRYHSPGTYSHGLPSAVHSHTIVSYPLNACLLLSSQGCTLWPPALGGVLVFDKCVWRAWRGVGQ